MLGVSSRRAAFLITAVAAAAAAGSAVFVLLRRDPTPPGAGIPLALAEDRAARVSSLRYELSFKIPSKRAEPIDAHLIATFALSDKTTALSFDFAQTGEHLRRVDGQRP